MIWDEEEETWSHLLTHSNRCFLPLFPSVLFILFWYRRRISQRQSLIELERVWEQNWDEEAARSRPDQTGDGSGGDPAHLQLFLRWD
jgi:hypothetical protein